MRGLAYAKVNLGLRVRPPRPDRLHPIESLIQSIDWSDTMEVETSDEDELIVEGHDLGVPRAENLAWRGVVAMRHGDSRAVRVALSKGIPVAAGLGGGSADAALGLVLGSRMFDRTEADAESVASELGADVSFCVVGGTAHVSGIGDVVEPRPALEGFALAIVVAPFELATAEVYRRWDDLDGPVGTPIADDALPPVLRDGFPVANDLEPAALDLEPRLGDWMGDVRAAWGQPVVMSGSGPSLMSFFPNREEADDAASAINRARAARAVVPIDRGWEIEEVRRSGGPEVQ